MSLNYYGVSVSAFKIMESKNIEQTITTGESGTVDSRLDITPLSGIITSQQEYSNSDISVDRNDATTTFANYGRTAERPLAIKHSDMPYIEQYETIKAFLAKPYPVANTTWTTASAALAQLGSWFNVGNLLVTTTIWNNKILGFENIRGTAKFRLVLNANPMQQGRLKLVWNPNGQIGLSNWRTQTLSQVTVLPGVEVDCRDSEGILHVPFIGNTNFYSIKQNSGNWGNVGLFVLSPLLTGASGETSLSYTLYVSFEDVELMGPMVPQSGTVKPSGKSKLLAETRKGGKISDLFNTTSTLLSKTSPSFLDPVVTPASWVSSFVGKALNAFGYAKPPVDNPPMLVSQLKIPYMSNYSGFSTAPTLALRHDNSVDIEDNNLNGIDQMSFDYIKQVPALVEIFQFSTGDTTGGSIFSAGIPPWYTSATTSVTRASFTNGGHTTTLAYPAPVGFLARRFAFNRGAMRVTLRFVKTQFHTGRYIITWTPTISYTTAPTVTSSSYSLRHIVDLAGPDEITLDLPFMIPQDWLEVGYEGYPGHLDIICLNPLRCPETCNGTVNVLMYLSGGCDFALAAPLNTPGSTVPEMPMFAQSGLMSGQNPVLDQTLIGDTGVCKDSDFSVERSSCGEVFTHLRQLLGKYAVIQSGINASNWMATSGTAEALQSIYINPYYILTALPGFTTASGLLGNPFCFQSALVNGFAFMKGSVKVAMSAPYSSLNNLIYSTLYIKSGVSINVSSVYTSNDSVSGGDLRLATNNGVPNELTQWHNASVGTAEVTVPYYSKYRITPTDLTSSSSYLPHTVVGFTSPSNNPAGGPTPLVYVPMIATGEDFQLSVFLGFPGYLYSYA